VFKKIVAGGQMKYGILIAFALIIPIIVGANTISEYSLEELGYAGIEATNMEEFECLDAEILNVDTNNSVYTVLSIHAEFVPISDGKAIVRTYLNDANISELKPEDFSDGWARIILPREKQEQVNSIRICGKASLTISKIRIFNDSKIGLYFKEDFSREHSFSQEVSNPTPAPGEEFTVRAILRNYGSKESYAEIRYRKENLDEWLPSIEVLKGKTSAEGIIPKCIERNEQEECVVPGELRIEYTARVKKPLKLTLFPAVAQYENVFGEKKQIESNRLNMEITEPEIKIEASMLPEKNTLKTGEKTRAIITIKNNGTSALYNLSVELNNEEMIEIEGKEQWLIKEIKAGELKEYDLNITSVVSGISEIGCTISYLDYNVTETRCKNAEIVFEQAELNPAILAGAGLLIIGIVIYAYFALKKGYND
jgi:hypothetical protein